MKLPLNQPVPPAQFIAPATPDLPAYTKKEYGFFDSLGAAFRLENDVVNAVEMMTVPQYARDDNFNLVDELKPYEHFYMNYPESFAGIRSRSHLQDKIAQLSQEEDDRARLQAAGWAGIAAQLVAGNLSPTTFIPLVGQGKGIKAIAKSAMLGAAAATLQEVPLQLQQETRTLEESAIGVASGTILAGVIGAGVSLMRPAERLAAEAGIVKTADNAVDAHAGTASGMVQESVPAPKVYEVAKADLDELSRPVTFVDRNFDTFIETKGEIRPVATKEDVLAFKNTVTTLDPKARILDSESPKFQEFEATVQQRAQAAVLSGRLPNDEKLIRTIAEDVLREQKIDAVRVKDGEQNVLKVMNKEILKTESKAVEQAQKETFDALKEAAIKSGYDHIKMPDGTITRISDNEVVDLAEQVATETAITPPNTSSSAAAAVNSAATRLPGAGGIKGLFGSNVGFGKLVRLSPVTRVLAQELSGHAQWVQAQLSTAGLRLQGNAAGFVSSFGGTVENRVKGHYKKLHDALNIIDDQWVKYVYGTEAKPELASNMRAVIRAAQTQGKMSKAEFRKEISQAVWMEDNFEGVKEAREAADLIAAKFYEPFKQEAKETGLIDKFPEELIDPRYINRVFDNDLVARNGPEFIRRMATYYEGNLTTKLSVAVQKLNEKIKNGEEIAGILEADIETVGALRAKFEGELTQITKSPLAAVEDEYRRVRKLRRQNGAESPTSYIELVNGQPMERFAVDGTTTKTHMKMLRETPGFKKWAAERTQLRKKIAAMQELEKTPKEKRAIEAQKMRDSFVTDRLDLTESFRKQGGENIDILAGKADFKLVSVERAEELRDKILGTHNRLPAMEILQGERGPELMRMLAIPTEDIQDFLHTDIEFLLRTYTRTMAADLELTRSFGSADAAMEFRTIEKEILEKITAAKTEKERAAIYAHGKEITDDLKAQIGRLRHTWGIPNNPTGASTRLARVMQNINTLRFMGSVLVSSIPDVARPVMKYGLTAVMRDAVVPMIRDFKTFKMAAREAKLAGVALDTVLHTRAYQLADIMDDMGQHSKFERGLEFATSKIGIIAAFDYWTSAMKQFSAVAANAQIFDNIERLVKTTDGDVEAREFLNAVGIDKLTAYQLWDRVTSMDGGGKVNDVWVPNTESWERDAVTRTYRAALAGEVDSSIVTPGLERPLWMDGKSLGLKLIGQFRSFAFSSTQKTLMAGLQQRDTAFFQGTMISLAFGAASYYLYATAAGGAIEKRMQEASPEHWMDEMISRSGILGVFSEVQRMAERIPLTQGVANIDNIVNDANSRSARRGGDDLISAVFGPSFDLANTASRIATGLDKPTQAVIGQAFNLLPYNNVFWLRRIFDALENNVKSNFPERRQ